MIPAATPDHFLGDAAYAAFTPAWMSVKAFATMSVGCGANNDCVHINHTPLPEWNYVADGDAETVHDQRRNIATFQGWMR